MGVALLAVVTVVFVPVDVHGADVLVVNTEEDQKELQVNIESPDSRSGVSLGDSDLESKGEGNRFILSPGGL